MAPSKGLYDVSVRQEGLYDVSEETFLVELFDSRYTTKRGCREDGGTPDISTNLANLQASVLKKAFSTDGANWRNIKCNK
jgi:hypothetical protein